MQTEWRLAVDIGGTFTDVVLLDALSGNTVVAKTLTTPVEPLRGVREGCVKAWSKAGIKPAQVVGAVVHATTLVTNALIEGKTARAALVTTRGFADTLLIRDEHRYDMYDLQIEFPPPPIARPDIYEVDERTLAGGRVLQAPDDAQVDELGRTLSGQRYEVVALCFLHAYANPANEKAVAARLHDLLHIPVTISSDVAPQIREFPRMTTVACNAVTMPLVGQYLGEFQEWLRKQQAGSTLLIMLSNGGVVSSTDAARTPIRMVESGPAAGALASAWHARRAAENRLFSFDMGGTTAKACLINAFEPALTPDFEIARMYRFKKGSGYPVTVPSVDLVEIGAGGGSIARVDALGLLKVGPDSAGAEPGPACYGHGGTAPTVTDADLLLGYLDPDYFLGGEMKLDVDAAWQAISSLAKATDLDPINVAVGIHELVNRNMAAAARMHGVERGADLRGIPMIAFGGAGPIHACGVASLLEAEKVYFPPNASVLSAFGTLVTPARVDLARSLVTTLRSVEVADRDRLLEDMRAEARGVLGAAGIAATEVHFRYGIDARYVGQGNEITVWVGEGEQWPVEPDEVLRRFASQYESVYGMSIADVAVEVVTWRLSAFAPVPDVDLADAVLADAPVEPVRSRMARFARGGGSVRVSVYERAQLLAGAHVEGPAFIEERETTIVLPHGWNAEVLRGGSIVATCAR